MKHYAKALFGLLAGAVLICAATGCTAVQTKKAKSVTLTVSAAASLQNALIDIQKQYKEEQPNIELAFNFGASGSLQQQIEQGAPVDLFFSAAEDKFQTLVKKGFIDKEERTGVLGNELVLIVPKNSGKRITSLTSLEQLDVKQLALGTPEVVPAGKYAQQALMNLKLWSAVEQKVVYAKDVRQVLTYVETNNVDGGLVYKTDALVSNKVDIVDTVPASMHESIIYPLGIIKATSHKKEAAALYHYLQTEEALHVFEKYGFTILK
ncbi:molybdate ABC transporter substrate-binding protein [Bacillus sp. 165]|uniref:molybdate ABC transporter substrate-binding protein n=1 Tax=Bacillus sp. 165 TaxID=1529117 RepID=UPI001ADD1694|nr:molybdate ABC transporter substrate-binding protein [Bacillus sp. 165]